MPSVAFATWSVKEATNVLHEARKKKVNKNYLLSELKCFSWREEYSKNISQRDEIYICVSSKGAN